MKNTVKILKTAMDILLIVLVALLAIVTIVMVALKLGGDGQMMIGGVGFGRVVTGSMETAIPTGSFVIIREVDAEDIVIGDVLMFSSDDPTVPEGYPVTHRVVDIFTDEQGVLSFITKGDANLKADEYSVPAANIYGRVVASSEWIGAVIGFSQRPFIYPILISLLALDLVFNAIVVYKQAKTLQQSSKE